MLPRAVDTKVDSEVDGGPPGVLLFAVDAHLNQFRIYIVIVLVTHVFENLVTLLLRNWLNVHREGTYSPSWTDVDIVGFTQIILRVESIRF